MKTCLVVVHLVLSCLAVSGGARPNVDFILTDDQRWDALSCMGNAHLQTPHIDRLADEGIKGELPDEKIR